MKKLFLLFLAGIIFLSGCSREKAFILFSSNPITLENFSLEKNEFYFQQGQRIYYVLINPKPFTSNVLRLQILRIDRKSPLYGYDIQQAKDIEIDINQQYITDYFCIHREGYYKLRIFSQDKMNKPVAEADFEVNPL